MAQRHNRKRTRHRPTRISAGSQDVSELLSFMPHACTKMPDLYWSDNLSTSRTTSTHTSRSTSPSSQPTVSQGVRFRMTTGSETFSSRSQRIFGGLEDEAESTDLCGPMLDVVLALFGAIDYDDAMC